MHFTDDDRLHLIRACALAEEAQRPPSSLGRKPEPRWAALVAGPEGELSAAVFSPGDPEDAVRKLLASERSWRGKGNTLYLTMEPKAGFDRLPPVTESVRRTELKRVVIGTFDPAQRYQGEGRVTLERMGIEVVLADGEAARRCQLLLDDYAKWLQRGLAVLRVQLELGQSADGSLDLHFPPEGPAISADAVICRTGAKGRMGGKGDIWRVVLDETGDESPGARTLLYQLKPAAAGVRALPMREGHPDLGAVLRDLAASGLVSVELASDPELFRQALRSGLIDSVRAGGALEGESFRALSKAGKVRLTGGERPLEIRLNGARLVSGSKPYVEARVELC